MLPDVASHPAPAACPFIVFKQWLAWRMNDNLGRTQNNAPALVMSHCCVFAPLHLALTTVLPLLESQQVAGVLPTMPIAAAPETTVVAASSDRRAP